MSILQELWYGNIRPNEDKVITDEEKKLVSLIARHHETLSSSLKNDELNVFEKYAWAYRRRIHNEYIYACNRQYATDGGKCNAKPNHRNRKQAKEQAHTFLGITTDMSLSFQPSFEYV